MERPRTCLLAPGSGVLQRPASATVTARVNPMFSVEPLGADRPYLAALEGGDEVLLSTIGRATHDFDTEIRPMERLRALVPG